MNNLRNKVQLIGHIGQTPEIFTFDSGNKKASFSVATNSSYRNKKGDRVEDTQWHNIVAFGKTADIIENYLDKGKEVAIEGKLSTRSYESKDGAKRYVTEIIVSDLLMLGKKEVAKAF